jgi:hypothetical protein
MAKVDLQFQLVGQEVAADHGYHLFAALARLTAELHADDEVGVHPISGRLICGRNSWVRPLRQTRFAAQGGDLSKAAPSADPIAVSWK